MAAQHPNSGALRRRLGVSRRRHVFSRPGGYVVAFELPSCCTLSKRPKTVASENDGNSLARPWWESRWRTHPVASPHLQFHIDILRKVNFDSSEAF